MAGTLQVNDRTAWKPAGWIYNNILERIALRLEADDADLANTVFDSLGPMPGYLDLCLEPADRVQLFLRAAEEVCRRAEDAGASAFPDHGFFEPFIGELHHLLQSLHADPRVLRE
jgi:hypothetical protein